MATRGWAGSRRRIISPNYFILTPLAIFSVLPLAYLVSTAFKPVDELFLYPPRFLVSRPTLRNFEDLIITTGILTVPFTRYVFNSVAITLVTVVLNILVSCMAGYVLAKHRIPGRNLIFAVVISALMFAPHVTAIPRYLVVHNLGLINTYFGMVLPNIAQAYGLFLMKQFIEQVPDALLESARVDGAGEWTIFTRVIMPLSRPAWATLTIFVFISTWNDFVSVILYTRSEEMKTLVLLLYSLGAGASSPARQGEVNAAALLAILPVVITFMIMQRRVIETMAHSGIKA